MADKESAFMRRSGLTMVEILAVMGIIVILALLTTLGLQYIQHNARTSATRTTLENLRSMLTELEITAGLRQPGKWWWPDALPNPVDPLAVAPLNLDFWKAPYRVDTKLPAGLDATDDPAPLAGASTDPLAPAVRNTQIGMTLIEAVPANRKAIGQIPPRQLFVPAWSDALTYLVGDSVEYGGSYYRCRTEHAPSSQPPSASWDLNGNIAHILLDAWNNPIILVPASGLEVTVGGVTGHKITSPDSRPFFASAGPDGSFVKGDDNIYSFEN